MHALTRLLPAGPAARPAAADTAAALASGAAVSLIFPTADQGWLAWVALVPLLLALRACNLRRAAGLGALFGASTAFGIFGWLFAVPGFNAARFAVLAFYHSLYPVAWCVGVVALARGRWPTVVVAPALWVALELLRAEAGFLALPWATLAQSQHHDIAVLQLVAWTGEAGLSFLIVMSNVAIAAWLSAPPTTRPAALRVAAATAGLVALVHALGALALNDTGTARSVDVAVVQPNIGIHERDSAEGRQAIWRRLERLTRSADKGRPVLIAWPETAIDDPRHDGTLATHLEALSASTHASLLVGAAEVEKFASRAGEDVSLQDRAQYNSAYLLEQGAIVGEPYRKRRLLPFAEYLPWRDSVAWPAWLVPAVVDAAGGNDGTPLLVHADPQPTRVAVLICWENLFAAMSRQTVRDGAEIVVQLNNDAWFGASRAAAQHNAISVMRAVENGVPFVIASNAGPSQAIDAHGRVLAQLGEIGGQGVVVATLPLRHGQTLYTRIGNVFAWLCTGVVVAAFAALWRAAPVVLLSPVILKKTP